MYTKHFTMTALAILSPLLFHTINALPNPNAAHDSAALVKDSQLVKRECHPTACKQCIEGCQANPYGGGIGQGLCIAECPDANGCNEYCE